MSIDSRQEDQDANTKRVRVIAMEAREDAEMVVVGEEAAYDTFLPRHTLAEYHFESCTVCCLP